jgi:hypothetical protein
MQALRSRAFLILACLAPAVLGASAAATAQGNAPQTAPAAEKLPAARAVIDRFAEVTNGKAQVENTSSIRLKGTLTLESMGMKGDFERLSAKPDKMLLKSSLGGMGTTLIGYDGKVAWMESPMLGGSQLLEGTELVGTLMQASYDATLMPDREYEKLEVVAREPFEGKDCYKVLAVYRAPADPAEAKASEAVRTSYSWFDVESGLQLGSKGTQAQAGSEIEVTSIHGDYKKFGDYTFPARMTQEISGMKVLITLDTVEYDKVDPKTFDLPEGVRALLKDDAKAPVPAGSGGK